MHVRGVTRRGLVRSALAPFVGPVIGLGVLTAVVNPAAGNGAFPDSQTVLAPADRPQEIVLATNFGLIRSENSGQTWLWSCEQDLNGMRNLYQLGAPPGDRLYARDSGGLIFTDDGGCSWRQAGGGLLDGATIADAFPDPTNPQRALAVAVSLGGVQASDRLLESTDGGETFTILRYTAPPGDRISGVEISRSDPDVVYLVVLGGSDGLEPRLARSADGGSTWTEHDLTAALGEGPVLLVAVDSEDSGRVFLRASGSTTARLAIADNGGVDVRIPLSIDGGFLSGFVRTSDGTILVSGLMGAEPMLQRSTDRGATFQPVPNPPHLWGLSQRGGTIYGAAKTGEPFAVATSIDDGNTWQGLMRYADVHGIDACVSQQCQDICLTEASVQLWPREICSNAPDSSPGTDAASSAGPDGGVGRGAEGAHCGCEVDAVPRSLTPALIAAALLLRCRRRGALRHHPRAPALAPPAGRGVRRPANK